MRTVLLALLFPTLAPAEEYPDPGAALAAEERYALALYSGPALSPEPVASPTDDDETTASIFAGFDDRIPPAGIRIASRHGDSALPREAIEEDGSIDGRMMTFISSYEASEDDYDAVWHGSVTPLPRPRPTLMTVCEVRDWQLAARSRQASTAIGRYQIVGGTLRRLLADLDLPCDRMFDGPTQDALALELLNRRGWQQFKRGEMTVEDFGHELAGEWAAFPAVHGPGAGKSRYHGIAGNRSLVSRADYLAFLGGLRSPAPELQMAAYE